MTPEQELAQINAQLELDAINAQLAEADAPDVPDAEPAEEMGFLEKAGRGVSHAIGGFNKGMVDIANLPFALSGAATKGVANLMGYDDPETFDLYDTPVIGEGLQAATAPALPEGESTIADMARTGLEWGGGGIFNAAAKAPIAMDVLMGTGAAVGEQLAGDTGEMAGGLTGALTSALRGKVPTTLPFTEARATAKANAQAEDFINANLVDQPQAVNTLRENVNKGVKGTLLDLTSDIGLTGVEQTGGLTHAGKKAILDTQAERAAQVVEDIQAPFGGEAADAAQQTARGLAKARQQRIEQAGKSRIEGQRADAEAGLAQTRAQMQSADDMAEEVLQQQAEKSSVVAPDKPTYEASADVARKINQRQKLYEAEIEAPAWKAFDEGAPVEAFGMKMAVDDVMQGLQPEELAAMQSRYGTELKHIQNWSGDVAPKSISTVRSQISEGVSNAESFGAAERNMSKIVKAMDDHLAATGNQAYSNAVAATKAKHDQFSSGNLGKVRRKAEPQELLEKMRLTGDAGKSSAQSLKATGDEEVLQGVEEYFKTKTKGEKVDDKFLAKYDGFLSEFTALGDEYAELAAANARGEEAAGLSKALSAKHKAQREAYEKQAATALPQTQSKVRELQGRAAKGVTAQYADDAQATMKKLLSDPNRVNDLKTLKTTMDKQGKTGSLKGHARDIITKKLISGKTGSAKIKNAALDDLDDMRTSLVDSGLIGADEFDAMVDAAGRAANSKELRKNMIDVRVGKTSDETANLAASAISAGLVQGLSGSSSLVMTGAIRRSVKKLLKKNVYNEAAMARVDEFLANPETYLNQISASGKAEIKKAETMQEAADAIVSQLFGLGQIAADDE